MKKLNALKNHISLGRAQKTLRETNEVFTTLFRHGSLEIEFYKPERVDLQTPHDRDEIYVIASGKAIFQLAGDRTPVEPGDVLFVPAGVQHRFEEFDTDFATWVFFYGPIGGESKAE